MGNQFNYELDDRQIKLTMLSATVSVDENAWDKFKHIPTNDVKHFTTISTNLPKFEIGISRSIIVPVVFIVLIGGLSAMMFNFVDFKKKEKTTTEIPLEITPVVAKHTPPLIENKASVKNEILVPKTSTVAEKPIVSITPTITIEPVKKEVVVVTKTDSEKPKEKPIEKHIVIQKPTLDTVTKTTIFPTKKKKKKKEILEEIPVITPQSTIITNEPVKEPEIEIQ